MVDKWQLDEKNDALWRVLAPELMNATYQRRHDTDFKAAMAERRHWAKHNDTFNNVHRGWEPFIDYIVDDLDHIFDEIER